LTQHTPDREDEKRLAAAKSLELIEDGMLFGLGTGSTIAHLIPMLGERVAGGLRIRAVPTSARSSEAAKQHGIEVVDDFDGSERIDLAIDGADEVDPNLQLTKGGGGALLREKIVAACANRFVVVADSQKLVETLGRFPLPVEVIKLGWANVARQLDALGGAPERRAKPDGSPYLTDEGNYILDCHFGTIADPRALASEIDRIVGVVEHGLFVDMADLVIVGDPAGPRVVEAPAGRRRG
jgi:ribose 5-phosphate isomerase A